jgi:hypothetical protein
MNVMFMRPNHEIFENFLQNMQISIMQLNRIMTIDSSKEDETINVSTYTILQEVLSAALNSQGFLT